MKNVGEGMMPLRTEAAAQPAAARTQNLVSKNLVSNSQLRAKEVSLGLSPIIPPLEFRSVAPGLRHSFEKDYAAERKTLVNHYVAALFRPSGLAVANVFRQRLEDLNNHYTARSAPEPKTAEPVTIDRGSPIAYDAGRGVEEHTFVTVGVKGEGRVYEFTKGQDAERFVIDVRNASAQGALTQPSVRELSLRHHART